MLRKDFGAIFKPHSMSVSKYKRHICWCWWWSLLFWCCSSRPRWACVCRAWSPVFTIAIVCHCHCQQDKRQAGKGKIQSSKTIVLSWELTLDTCVFVNGGCHISSKRKSHHSLVSILKETYICIWVHHMGVPWLWFVDTHRSPKPQSLQNVSLGRPASSKRSGSHDSSHSSKIHPHTCAVHTNPTSTKLPHFCAIFLWWRGGEILFISSGNGRKEEWIRNFGHLPKMGLLYHQPPLWTTGCWVGLGSNSFR